MTHLTHNWGSWQAEWHIYSLTHSGENALLKGFLCGLLSDRTINSIHAALRSFEILLTIEIKVIVLFPHFFLWKELSLGITKYGLICEQKIKNKKSRLKLIPLFPCARAAQFWSCALLWDYAKSVFLSQGQHNGSITHRTFLLGQCFQISDLWITTLRPSCLTKAVIKLQLFLLAERSTVRFLFSVIRTWCTMHLALLVN